MKLSLIDKRIPQTLTNSKDIIQKDREHARQSSLTRSTRGQENEAWAVYKKNPSRQSWGGKFWRVCGVCSSELWLARKNNCLLSSIFPAGEGGFGQMMYWSPERSSQDSRDGFVHCPGLIFLAARWSGPATSWHVYFPLEFEFRGKSCVKREHGGEDGISCLLPCILLLYIGWI